MWLGRVTPAPWAHIHPLWTWGAELAGCAWVQRARLLCARPYAGARQLAGNAGRRGGQQDTSLCRPPALPPFPAYRPPPFPAYRLVKVLLVGHAHARIRHQLSNQVGKRTCRASSAWAVPCRAR